MSHYISVIPTSIPKDFSDEEPTPQSHPWHQYFGLCLPAPWCQAASLIFLWSMQDPSLKCQEQSAENQVSEGSLPWSLLESCPVDRHFKTTVKPHTTSRLQLGWRPNLWHDIAIYILIFCIIFLPWAKRLPEVKSQGWKGSSLSLDLALHFQNPLQFLQKLIFFSAEHLILMTPYYFLHFLGLFSS